MPFARLGGGVFVALAGVLLVVLLMGRPVPALSGVAVVALGAIVYEALKKRWYRGAVLPVLVLAAQSLDLDPPTPRSTCLIRGDTFHEMSILLRADSDSVSLSADVRDVVRGIDRSLPAYSMRALEDVVIESLGERRFAMLLLALFWIASFLAAVGLYGVVS